MRKTEISSESVTFVALSIRYGLIFGMGRSDKFIIANGVMMNRVELENRTIIVGCPKREKAKE